MTTFRVSSRSLMNGFIACGFGTQHSSIGLRVSGCCDKYENETKHVYVSSCELYKMKYNALGYISLTVSIMLIWRRVFVELIFCLFTKMLGLKKENKKKKKQKQTNKHYRIYSLYVV